MNLARAFTSRGLLLERLGMLRVSHDCRQRLNKVGNPRAAPEAAHASG